MLLYYVAPTSRLDDIKHDFHAERAPYVCSVAHIPTLVAFIAGRHRVDVAELSIVPITVDLYDVEEVAVGFFVCERVLEFHGPMAADSYLTALMFAVLGAESE